MPLILWWVVGGRWVLDGAYFWELLKSSFIVKKNKGKYPVGFELTFFLRGTEALASISSNLTIWVVCGTNSYAHAFLLGFRGSLTEPAAKRLAQKEFLIYFCASTSNFDILFEILKLKKKGLFN